MRCYIRFCSRRGEDTHAACSFLFGAGNQLSVQDTKTTIQKGVCRLNQTGVTAFAACSTQRIIDLTRMRRPAAFHKHFSCETVSKRRMHSVSAPMPQPDTRNDKPPKRGTVSHRITPHVSSLPPDDPWKTLSGGYNLPCWHPGRAPHLQNKDRVPIEIPW